MANGTRPAGGDGLVQRLLDRGFEFFSRSIWELELGQLSWAGRRLIKGARIAYLASSGFVEKRCMVRASALTYITMLSIVPLLAFVFSVAKGFGFYRQLRETQIDPFLDGIFAAQAVPEGQGVRATLDTVDAIEARGEDRFRDDRARYSESESAFIADALARPRSGTGT